MKHFKNFKEYQKDIFARLNQFTRVFKPWKKWEDANLTELNPCKKCDISKELHDNSHYYQMSGGAEEGLTKTCACCMGKTLWNIECFEKLAWYEDHDERLKGE